MADFLHNGTDIDGRDTFGMTALSWAVARGNSSAIDTLLHAGANPWLGGPSALLLAAQFGNKDLFFRLASVPRPERRHWTRPYLYAAVRSESPEIVADILGDPHEPVQLSTLRGVRSIPVLEMLVADDPGSVDDLIGIALADPDPAKMVAFALRSGASPNAPGPTRFGTALGACTDGLKPWSTDVVALLLAAGADPNLISGRVRPIWAAVEGMRSGQTDRSMRARSIFDQLVRAGADINLPNDENIPPSRTLFCRFRSERDRVIVSDLSDPLVALLAEAGLDFNAPWQGTRILPLVEAQTGVDSDMSRLLRRLGALP